MPPESDSSYVVEPSPAQQAQALTLPEFDSAIKRRAATFGQLAEAMYFSRPEWCKDEVGRLLHERYVEPLTEAFEANSGAIQSVLYCNKIIAATILTLRTEVRRLRLPRRRDRYALEVINNELESEDIAILELLDRCDRLFVDCSAHLDGEDLRVAAHGLYGLTGYLLTLLEKRAANRAQAIPEYDDNPLIEEQRRVLGEIARHYNRSAQRDAQVRYFAGMLAGLVVVGLGAGVLSSFEVPGDDRLADTSFIAGAVGAVVSVMTRMTSGNIHLRFETGPWLIRALGMFRPFIGAIFGLTLYASLVGGLFAVDAPDDATKAYFFFSVVAFLAGFSERFAQDMLSITEGRLRGQPEDDRAGPDRVDAEPAARERPGSAPGGI